MNAALSGMARFYLALALAIGIPTAAAGQTSIQSSEDRPPLGSTLTVDALGFLPSSTTVFGLLDTAVPDVISDRQDTGGLNTGEVARVGAHGSSWTQTFYRIDDADITDPRTSGTPLLIPGVNEWEQVNVATGIIPIDRGAPGMAVSLAPRRPWSAWVGWLDIAGTPSGFAAGSATMDPPAIERMNNLATGNGTAGGPITDHVGTFVSATLTRSSLFERDGTRAFNSTLGSIFANFLATPRPDETMRLTTWFQHTGFPMANHDALEQPDARERDLAFSAQLAWNRRLEKFPMNLSVFGGYTQRGRDTTAATPSPFVTMDRLTDGPVPDLLDAGDGTDRILQAGVHVSGDRSTGTGRFHRLVGGIEVTRNSTTQQAAWAGQVGELVNGIPARLWDWTDPSTPSSWHGTTFATYAADTLTFSPRFSVNVGLRFETVRGAASDGSTGTIAWNDWYPRGGLYVAITDFWKIAGFLQFARYGHRLPLSDLSWGDPTAPTASVYRWFGGDPSQPGAVGPLVERMGPGSAGNTDFATIDPALRRPALNEMTFGFESRPRPYAFVRMAAIARYESPLVGVVNVGVPTSTYTTIGVPDTGVDRVGSQDDQTLIFYNRSPSTYGADRFLVTNPDNDWETFVGVDLVGEVHAKRLYLLAGGTAGRSEALSANRGFGPLENDAGLLGELFIDPNAGEHAQGRVFTERGYTIKTSASYQFDHDWNAGIVARYQDGQHFARLVVLDTLNQGAEAVRAFRNGRTRFTYTMTVDGRVQKTFRIGGRAFIATLDAYNMFNQSSSVEEDQVTGAGPRIETAIQPPRVVRIGLRIPF